MSPTSSNNCNWYRTPVTLYTLHPACLIIQHASGGNLMVCKGVVGCSCGGVIPRATDGSALCVNVPARTVLSLATLWVLLWHVSQDLGQRNQTVNGSDVALHFHY